jgi:hypothetical protein
MEIKISPVKESIAVVYPRNYLQAPCLNPKVDKV